MRRGRKEGKGKEQQRKSGEWVGVGKGCLIFLFLFLSSLPGKRRRVMDMIIQGSFSS